MNINYPRFPRRASLAICAALLVLLPTGIHAAEKLPISVNIEGLSGPLLENVQRAVKLPPVLVEKGSVDQFLAESFVAQVPGKVREALQPFGFYKPDIKTSWEKKEDGIYYLGIRVTAGNPVKVGAINIAITGPGAQEAQLKMIVSDFPLKSGDILRQDIYEQAKSAILKKSLELGYLQAAFSAHAIAISLEHLTADIDLILATGSRFYFGNVIFTGKPGYPESFLRRYLEFKSGDVFSYDQMARTQANYAHADRFKEISINAGKDEAAYDRVPVEISLLPSPAKSAKVGAGYGTDTGPRATLRYQDLNVTELGQEFETEIQVSQVFQGFLSRFVFPGEADFRHFTALTAGLQREDTTTYLTKWFKVEAERARGFGKNQSGSVFLQARQENSTAGDQTTDSFLLLPGARFSDMHYDSAIRPRKGFNYQVELKGTHQLLGSSTGFAQLTTSGDMIIPLPAEFSLFMRARVGATWQNDPPQDLPITIRFFTGGDHSIRGYAYQSLGPQDDHGNVVGGRNLLVGSVEIERYIGKDWGVAVFYDAGNAFNNLSEFSAAQGAGVGVRYYSPIGPVRLDIARQVGVAQPDTRIHLTIGIGL